MKNSDSWRRKPCRATTGAFRQPASATTCENVFDELKNQWGWGGFTTQTLKPTRIMAGIIALVFNWWNIFCRLADPDEQMEAITSRPCSKTSSVVWPNPAASGCSIRA